MVKSITPTNKDQNLKGLNTPKEGFITKKKEQKFKQTPTGKITLINGLKMLDNMNQKQRNLPKQQKNTEKNKEQNKKDTSKNKDKQQSPKKEEEKKKNAKDLDEEDDSDSGEDINEGVVLNNTSIAEESDTEEDDSDESEDEETDVPNILGTSLADDSDSDDEDFEEDEEEAQVKKGVKMFKGLQKGNESMNSSKSDSDKSLEVGEEDDDSDVEFEAEEEADEEDDDDEEESEVEDEEESDEEEDEDEDDSEEEEEEDADDSKLGLKALLGNSIADDDDDDDDFVGTEEAEDDDDNISDEEDEEEEEEDDEQPKKNGTDKSGKQKKVDAALEEIKTDRKTVFVGNLPKDATKKQLKKLFRKFGSIDTIRLRGIVGKSLNMPKKIAAKTNKVHPRLKSVYAYIKFDSEESVKPALSMNGQVLEGNYLRVDTVYKTEKSPNPKKGVFVGNLSFSVDENTVRKHFEGCGDIDSVRVIRDNKTGIGRGFGYVNFKTADAATVALELNGTKVSNREIRVQPCTDKKKKHGKRSLSTESKPRYSPKKFKNNAEKAVHKGSDTRKGHQKQENTEGKQASPQQGKTFQGQKADLNKKGKNKLDKKKKKIAEMLTAKPKKATN